MNNNIGIILDDSVDDEIFRRWASDGQIEKAWLALLTILGIKSLITAPLCIRFASNSIVRQLNHEWRNKDAVTDVLSFPMQDGPDFSPEQPLGDIVLAIPFVHDAAKTLALSVEHHTLHLIVHGMLHLLAYDHQDDEEAIVMQALESTCLQQLGLENPYLNNV
ncbi:MAG: rRNA maturation RNase YbeY [Mariprofundaceae bacterium]|nr:rRNA maturation RNase YbeY [Mariprofundaceae bacterium]